MGHGEKSFRRYGRIFIILSLAASLAQPLAAEDLRIAAVQFEVSPELYDCSPTFEKAVTAIVESAVAKFDPDLVVFPEYTGVFASFFPFALPAEAADPVRALLSLDPGIREPRDFFLKYDPSVELDRIFGGIAKKHGIYILAGSYFAPVVRDTGFELRNRAVLYGPDGRRAYRQDKVFLTPYERDVLGISPGRMAESAGFEIDGTKLGLTICRDTFFEEWEKLFADVDVWIDIKANGQVFTKMQQENFRKALPERVDGADIPVGITVCLTGTFFDFLWQGRSSVIVSEENGGIATAAKAASASSQEILFFETD